MIVRLKAPPYKKNDRTGGGFNSMIVRLKGAGQHASKTP